MLVILPISYASRMLFLTKRIEYCIFLVSVCLFLLLPSLSISIHPTFIEILWRARWCVWGQRIKLWAKQTLLSKACNVMEKPDKATGRITTWCGKPWQGRCFGNSEERHVVSSEGLRDGFLRKVTSHLRPERWPGGSRWKVKARDWAQCIDKAGIWRWSSGCIWGLCPAEQCRLLCPGVCLDRYCHYLPLDLSFCTPTNIE